MSTTEDKPTAEWSFVDEMESLLPHMRAFARSLCHDHTLADDIVQSACLKAWAAADSFDRSAKMRPWILRIVRNEYLQHRRRAWRSVDVESGFLEEMLVDDTSAEMKSEASHAMKAIYALPIKQRDAVILILAAGLTYEEAGTILNCSPGTIKSRVNRARAALMDELNGIAPVISNDVTGMFGRTTLNELVEHAEDLMAQAA